MRKELFVVMSVVTVSEGEELLVVATAERLRAGTEEPAKVVASPTVDPATLGTVIVPKTSVWLCVSVNGDKSSSGFLLTGTNAPPEVGIWAIVVSLSVIPLVESVTSRVVARAGVLAVDRVPDELVVSGIRAVASVD